MIYLLYIYTAIMQYFFFAALEFLVFKRLDWKKHIPLAIFSAVVMTGVVTDVIKGFSTVIWIIIAVIIAHNVEKNM